MANDGEESSPPKNAEAEKRSETTKGPAESASFKYAVNPDILAAASKTPRLSVDEDWLARALSATPLTTFNTSSAAAVAAASNPHVFTPMVTGTPGFTHFINLSPADDELRDKVRSLQAEIEAQRRKVVDAAKALNAEKESGVERDRLITDLSREVEGFRLKGNLGIVLDKVNEVAQRKLLQSSAFQKAFLETKQCSAFVMSVDIRRSTELMLKARSPEGFAEFITTLCTSLMRTIQDSYGVFDKFTGDGILAFYPDFFSEPDAAYRVIAAADQCHEIFSRHYQQSRKLFSSVLTEVGLGIGIDYGQVHFVQMAGGLTVVGEPVVYACRLSGAPAGSTYLNQPAYEQVSDKCGPLCFTTERELDIKHEGRVLAYQAQLNKRPHLPPAPTWVEAGVEDEK